MKKDMVSLILTEDVVTINQARELLEETTGRRFDRTTLFRWINRGVGGVKLESIRLGREILTSKQAVTRFIRTRSNCSFES